MTWRSACTGPKPPILYITRNGLLEPLGQSQVLAYLRGLAGDYRITVVSFEKPEDLADRAAVAALRADCAARGIRWLPQSFRRRPRGLAPALGLARLFLLCLREARGRRGGSQGGDRAALIHARAYLPAAAALAAGRLTGTPFLFDMRALWPEELIVAGRLRRGSPLHRAIVAAERACLRRAAAVVSLTQAAVEHLRRSYPAELAGQRIAVIPTCADLDRFVPAPDAVEEKRAGPRVYGCVGTLLSGWFRLDWLAAFFQAAAARDPEARFQVVTRDDPDAVRAALGGGAALQDRLEVFALPPQRVHEAVQRHSVSVMFFTEGLSKLGSSPTRLGEALGCGLPAVANAGVGDVARIVEGRRVGVLAAGPAPDEMAATLDALDALLADPELPARCRRAAEEVFSLDAGTEAYRALYREVLGEGEARKRSQPVA